MLYWRYVTRRVPWNYTHSSGCSPVRRRYDDGGHYNVFYFSRARACSSNNNIVGFGGTTYTKAIVGGEKRRFDRIRTVFVPTVFILYDGNALGVALLYIILISYDFLGS